MTIFLISSIIVVLALMIAGKIRRIRNDFKGMDLPDMIKKLDDIQAECDEKIKKIEEEAIQEDYDKVKRKTGKFVHKGKIMQLEFLFKYSKSRVLLYCLRDSVIMKVPELSCERVYKHMDEFFRDDLPNGVNLKRDWMSLNRINYYELKK